MDKKSIWIAWVKTEVQCGVKMKKIVYSVMFSLIVMFTIIGRTDAITQILNNSVVVYYPMCESSGNLTDYKGKSNTTSVIGTPIYNVSDGLGGKCAIEFNANANYFKIGDNFGDNSPMYIIQHINQSNFSLYIRWRDDAVSEINDVPIFMADMVQTPSSTSEYMGIRTNAPDGAFSINIRTGDTLIDHNSAIDPNDSWHVIISTYDFTNDIFNLTLDGIEIKKSSAVINPLLFDKPMRFAIAGHVYYNIPAQDEVTVGEIAVFNTTLTKTNILELQTNNLRTLLSNFSDTVSPVIGAFSLNNSYLHPTFIINATASVSDETNLTSCFFNINQTGKQINYTKAVTGASDQCSQNFTISGSVGSVVNISLRVNDTSGNYLMNSIVKTILNNFSTANNVSITPFPLNANTQTKSHCNFTDVDGDTAQGNETFWYLNKTKLTTSINITRLGASNVTLNANITYSCAWYDGTGYGVAVNSSQVTVGDTTPPSFEGNATSSSSVTVNSAITLFVNVSDNGNIGVVISETENPNGIKTNQTMSLQSGALNDGRWSISYTTSLVGTHSVVFYATDSNNNKANTGNELEFLVTTASSSPPSGGGGGSSDTIILQGNVTPLISFGTPLLDFLIITTPSEQEKVLRLSNVGNADFTDGKISVKGNAGKFITAKICDLEQTICATERIIIKTGASALLVLRGAFTGEIGAGVDGVVSLSGNRDFELLLQISRPPLYNLGIRQLAALPLMNEAIALVIVYLSVVVIMTGLINLAR